MLHAASSMLCAPGFACPGDSFHLVLWLFLTTNCPVCQAPDVFPVLVCDCRLPLNDIMRPFSSELMSTALQVLSEDNEENGLLCLRISFELHKQYRPALEDFVPKFLDLVRKVRTALHVPAPCACL